MRENLRNEAKNLSDSEIVAKAIAEPDFYSLVIERYEAKLARYIYRLTNISDEDVKDLLQEIFIKAYENLRDYDKERSFSSWIYRIAHNQVISNFRKLKARPEISHSIDDEEISTQFAVDVGIPEHIDASLQKAEIRTALSRIDEKYREVLILRYFEDKSYEEISEILKKSQGTIATLISRAHKKCREVIIQRKP